MAHFHSDRWILKDDLGIVHAGDHLARTVLLADLPFAVRVTGKWGAGKTSLLRRAFATLGGKPIAQAVPLGSERAEEKSDLKGWNNLAGDVRYKKLGWDHDLRQRWQVTLPIWYSPWQHQNADNPLVPLLKEICLQYRGWVKVKADTERAIREKGLAGLSLLERATGVAISLFSQRTIKVATGTPESVSQAWTEGHKLESLSDGQRFHLLFEDAVENALHNLIKREKADANREALPEPTKDDYKKARMVIFIDDLDRCDEATVVAMLECIKLYLETKRCVFVFGIDDNAVARALRHHWDGRSDHDNREYLEKLFQATVVVPHPHPNRVAAFIADQFKEHQIVDADLHAADVVALLEPNPRKLKNFTNTLCANWTSLVKYQPDLDEEVSDELQSQTPPSEDARGYLKRNQFFTRFMITCYLRVFHRQVWRVIEHEPKMFPLLRHVLTGNELKDASLATEEQMARHLFHRAFFHVLSAHDVELQKEGQEKHRDLVLQDAVDRFIDCVDQKRSDSHLIALFKKATDVDTPLDEVLLYLPQGPQV